MVDDRSHVCLCCGTERSRALGAGCWALLVCKFPIVWVGAKPTGGSSSQVNQGPTSTTHTACLSVGTWNNQDEVRGRTPVMLPSHWETPPTPRLFKRVHEQKEATKLHINPKLSAPDMFPGLHNRNGYCYVLDKFSLGKPPPLFTAYSMQWRRFLLSLSSPLMLLIGARAPANGWLLTLKDGRNRLITGMNLLSLASTGRVVQHSEITLLWCLGGNCCQIGLAAVLQPASVIRVSCHSGVVISSSAGIYLTSLIRARQR